MPAQETAHPGTVAELLRWHEASWPALRSVGGQVMSYGRLREQVDYTVEALNRRASDAETQSRSC